MNYLDLTIEEIHKALLEGKTNPLELTKEAIKRAKENKDNAFEMLIEEDALKKELNVKKNDAIITLLRDNKANEKAIKLLGKEFDLDNIELDDNGKVKNANDLIKGVKENYADFFTQEKDGGVNPKNPNNNEPQSITKEALKKMSLEERSKLASENRELYDSLRT